MEKYKISFDKLDLVALINFNGKVKSENHYKIIQLHKQKIEKNTTNWQQVKELLDEFKKYKLLEIDNRNRV